jgi:hypothetical protein
MMRKTTNLILGTSLVALMVMTGCDWEDTSSDSFNTSRGAGITVNFSGYYRPKSGSFLVPNNITHFVMTQVGNSLEVYDNNNSYYTGSVGSPGVQANRSTVAGVYGAGATMLQSQITFSGVNAATGLDVNFVGIIHVVAVSHVTGNSTTFTEANTVDSVDATATNTLGTVNLDIIAPPVTITDQTQTTSEDSDSGQQTVSTVNNTTTTYEISEENSQFVIDGNWIEGGSVSGISAIAPSTASTFSSTTTTTP